MPSRMNIGQIFEAVLGRAGKELGLKFATPIFKQKVIEYKWLHHLSLNQTAAKFSIPNTGTISTWEKLYCSYGFSGLLAKKRGRPSMKKSKSKNKVETR